MEKIELVEEEKVVGGAEVKRVGDLGVKEEGFLCLVLGEMGIEGWGER